jgi:hypothetical protein
MLQPIAPETAENGLLFVYIFLICIKLPFFNIKIKNMSSVNSPVNTVTWCDIRQISRYTGISMQDYIPALALAGSDDVYVALYRSHEL